MSNGRTRTGVQLPLSLDRPRPGSFGRGDQLARLAAQAIQSSGKSRELIAAEMAELLGTRISVSQLNAWTAPGKPFHRMPGEFIGAFCAATGDHAIVKVLAGQAGVHVVGAADAARLRVLEIDERIRQLRKEKADHQDLLQELRPRGAQR